ncbi:MAG: hypothetical protein ACI9OJ_005974 [Myxococcota bacterium]|jgi:hypothetical protein
MISAEVRTEIRRLFYAEHWKVGTIAAQFESATLNDRSTPLSWC